MTTMDYSLHIQLSSSEGAVIRALGLIERRGFTLKACSVGEPDGMDRDLDVKVTSTRPGDLLKRQLERLHDVYHVDLKPVAPKKSRNPGIWPITRRN